MMPPGGGKGSLPDAVRAGLSRGGRGLAGGVWLSGGVAYAGGGACPGGVAYPGGGAWCLVVAYPGGWWCRGRGLLWGRGLASGGRGLPKGGVC